MHDVSRSLKLAENQEVQKNELEDKLVPGIGKAKNGQQKITLSHSCPIF